METYVRMRRIPETDLARITVREVDEQRILLKQLKSFRPTHTLNPFRKAVPDIVNLQHEMLGERGPTEWRHIERAISQSKESADGVSRNIEVARALYDYCAEHDFVSYAKPVPRWNVGYGNDVAFWGQFYSVWDGQAAYVHFDPRLTHQLTAKARKFVFSLMHQRLRVDDPDFSDVGLYIVAFGRGEGARRTVIPHSAAGLELYSYDQLNDMIDTTYRLWASELAYREERVRRAAGGSNPMSF
jgi:hypothetical protein